MTTPIIITVPRDYLTESKVSVVEDGVAMTPSRKRRLDHLSWEEKMQRKKLKNRVAAQTSRDRKKAKMDDMEMRVMHLEESNARLVSEVESLRALNERLVSENASLRVARDVGGAPGSAASQPQQKEGPPAALRVARLLVTLYLLSQTSSRTSTRANTSILSSPSPTPCSKSLIQALQERLQMSKAGTLNSVLKELKWWGPRQSTWNPVKVES